MKESIAKDLRQFIVEQLLFGQGGDQLKDADSLIARGLIDSTGVLEIVTFLEQRFSIAIDQEELVPNNLDSIDRIVDFVQKKQASAF
jgi:acyl carrier protein